MPRLPRLLFGIVLLLWMPLAMAQNNLGELLDAGATRLSPKAFKEEVVQRVIAGPTAPGGQIEVMYAQTGVISGRGSYQDPAQVRSGQISGAWTLDDNGRVCSTMLVGADRGVLLPPRCQSWFKYKGDYFISDSDSDRSARVLRRTLKQ